MAIRPCRPSPRLTLGTIIPRDAVTPIFGDPFLTPEHVIELFDQVAVTYYLKCVIVTLHYHE